MGAVKFTQQMTVPQFEKLFPDDDACKRYLVARRWPNGIKCPRCNNENVYPVTNRPYHWQCTKCADKGDIASLCLSERFLRTQTFRSEHGSRLST